MPTLQIQLLGDFRLHEDGKPLLVPKQASTRSLLAYLVFPCAIPITRKDLAILFAPTAPYLDAQQNLARLYQELLQSLPAVDAWLETGEEEWQWRSDVQIETDVAAFEAAVAGAAHGEDPTLRRVHLEEAIRCYAGDFLPGCHEAWVESVRQRLRSQWQAALRQLTDLQEQQGDTLAAIACARRLWQHDPLYAPEYQRLVHLHVLQGERASALAALQHRLQMALQGQGGVVLLEGAAGIGKTSLALSCQKRAGALGTIFVTGHCYERGASEPFSLWQELLENVAASAGVKVEQLPEPLGNAPPVASLAPLLNAVATWLRAVAGEHPLVLLLDDIHWADPDSLELLEFVARRLDQIPLLIIATYRSEEVDRFHPLHTLLPSLRRNRSVEAIPLAPLSLDDTVRLVEAHLGPCSARLADYLHSRAEGHPLFLVELLHDLIERKLVTQGALGWWLAPLQPVALPALLTQLISGRVLRLGADAEMLLSVASVVGEQWELSVVEAILQWPEETLLGVLERVLAARLITLKDEFAEQYQFTHGLIREVLYHQQVVRRRRQLHAQICALLEARNALPSQPAAMARPKGSGELAYHAYAAHEWEKALRYNLAAGDNALHRSAG